MIDGFRVLGSVIGTPLACDKYIESGIEKTATLTEKLSKIAKTSPKKRTPATKTEFKIN